ncbi:hxlR-like helix-turn-helix family protein [Mycobacterium xenopi 4042]|uniref:HxlR-like helix-turn-helix family protein n=1 Tax=Mycobacterium xenopi 4042 TaxID=1299334 RepID=X8DKS0_MYCXE|nr:hxlR-like helix-turn-helix family protein [Mycobacterium xenopi 4042]
MLPRTYEHQVCSIARSLELIGDRWTLLIVRDALRGVRRFDDFRARLGVAHNVLSDRLSRLTEAGVLERRRYQQRPDRYEYHPTQQGLDLWPVLMSLLLWATATSHPTDRPRSCHIATAGPAHVPADVCHLRDAARAARCRAHARAGRRVYCVMQATLK